uniref:Uncharacterized protein n=1 Tax=Romanomermis culicivorax TaxID=13658 RepID=A0A915K4H2_ROMCU
MDPKRFTALFGKHNSTGYEEANLDPNSILSILDLRNVEQFVDSFVVEIEHQNETITKGDSGAPATCWKDGRVFIQGVLASARVKEEIKNFGEYNLNISILEDIQFTDVNAMKRWIVETFQHVDTPSLWHRNLSQYGHNLMEQPSYSSILMNEELLNGYYCDTQGPYNHELITPWWSHADYLRHMWRIDCQRNPQLLGMNYAVAVTMTHMAH